MQYLYLLLNLGSVSLPFLFSFHPKMRFIQFWKPFLLSTSLVAFVFLVWDAIFTHIGIWGFNPDYLVGFFFLKMPLEEWLFFFCIPYASIFIHYALGYLAPSWKLSLKTTRWISTLAFGLAAALTVIHHQKWYSFVNFGVLALTVFLGQRYFIESLQRFYIAFIFILIPFFIVNGILTGTGLGNPVVWYDDTQNLGIRLGTIPVEDIGYAFSMLWGNVMLFEWIKSKKQGGLKQR